MKWTIGPASPGLKKATQWVFVFSLSIVSAARAQTRTVAERLGLPEDTKLLIIHADDLAVAHSVDQASFKALAAHAVSSASVMVPCPWLTEVAEFARRHPEADIGLHLTLTSEWKTYRWGPVAGRDLVPGLLDPGGYFWADVPPVVRHAKPEEVEREIHAQVEEALKLGILPTHLDTHMGALAANPAFYAAFAKVAHEYHLPFLAVRVNDARREWLKNLNAKDIVLDSLIMADGHVSPGHGADFYASAIRNLKPGLTEMIVHLGQDDPELRAITVDHPDYGAAWRQHDFQEVMSPGFKRLLEVNRVKVIGWRDLERLVQ
jgi:predicted glycoside hydrolase/deacetylase ChbG (UPF0249 family)